MLRMFYHGFKCFSCVFASISDACISVSSDFRGMLQMLYLDISKVDRVLHLSPRFLLPRLGVSSFSRRWLGIRRPLSLFSMLVMFGAARAPHGRVKPRGKRTMYARPGASETDNFILRSSRMLLPSGPVEKICMYENPPVTVMTQSNWTASSQKTKCS